jgi:hypothetical protein
MKTLFVLNDPASGTEGLTTRFGSPPFPWPNARTKRFGCF